MSRECISNADPQPWQTAALVPVELDGRVKGIDACIAPAIRTLRDAGVGTVGSCCGHGECPPSVVLTSHHEALKAAEVIQSVDDRRWEVKAWVLATVAVAAPSASEEGESA